MRAIVATLAVLGAISVASVAGAENEANSDSKSETIGFDNAQWIWSLPAEGEALQTLPAGVGYFRAALTVPKKTKTQSAEVMITADNLFALSVVPNCL